VAKSLPFRLILASGSRGRRLLLEQAGYSFDILPANIDEPTDAPAGDIRRYVAETAWRKAAAVAGQVDSSIIIAADTVGWHRGQVVGKPDDADHARRILRSLSGQGHELWTGVVLWRRPDDAQLARQVQSRLFMRPLSEADLDAYIASNRWVGASGAYAMESANDPILTLLAGSYSNVVGLPLETLEADLLHLWQLPRHDPPTDTLAHP
jgi:septum formation protein